MSNLIPPLLFAGLIAAAPLAAVERGDSYDSVISEKGAPSGKLNSGSVQILKYSDQEIRLEKGVVVSIRGVGRSAAPAVKPQPPQGIPASPPELRWTESFPEAINLAKETDRKVFMFFTGSDWCVWCKRLEAEVLSTPQFARFAPERFVLLKVDFPKSTQQPEDLVAQNQALAKRFRVNGFPTVIVFSADGKRLADLGYEPGGPAPFIEKLSMIK
ncbi:MAG: thioredoxin family protein [Opitutaceae bacterium]|nr:thioredoxin family protein [Opitutaceae bacterium]